MPPITRAQLVNQKDLTVDELAALADTIMLSQASFQTLMAEVDNDRLNSEVLALRQRPAASPTPAKEKKKTRVKQETCWIHQKWGKDAKSCRQPCSWTGNGYWGGSKDKVPPPRRERLWPPATPVRHQLRHGHRRPCLHLRLQLRSIPGTRPSHGQGTGLPVVTH